MSDFTKRLDGIGKRLDIAAVDVRHLKPPFKKEVCLQRALMVDYGDGLGKIINGVAHVELAPMLVGGVESIRLLLATGDLIRDLLAGPVSGQHAGELREALKRIGELADSIDAAKQLAVKEHDAFHANDEKMKGPIH